MPLTRGKIIDRVAGALGDNSTEFRTYMEDSFNNMLDALFDAHDWNWKHKSSDFTTVSGTEEYNLSDTGIVSGLGDIRSSTDIEVIYDKTNGKFLVKTNLRDIRKHFPKEDQPSQPTHYAPWGSKTIFLHGNPNGAFLIKFLYVAKATYPEDLSSPPLDLDDVELENDLGIPSYVHYLFEKMCLAEGMLYFDDNRRNNLLEEITKLWLRNAVAADMKHLENDARFKFWEEELASNGGTFEDFLRLTWWNPED